MSTEPMFTGFVDIFNFPTVKDGIIYRKQFVPDYLEQKKINNFGNVDKITVMGTHETIVSEEEFDAVQQTLDERSVSKKRGRIGKKPGSLTVEY